MMIINTDNSIHISMPNQGSTLVDTGFKVIQKANRTVVYSAGPGGLHYAEHDMPAARYSLAHDVPRPIHANRELADKYPAPAGRAQFELDIRALLQP